jgi:hypothetical protein
LRQIDSIFSSKFSHKILREGAEKSKYSNPLQYSMRSFSSNGQPEIRLSSALDSIVTLSNIRLTNLLNPEKLGGIDKLNPPNLNLVNSLQEKTIYGK